MCTHMQCADTGEYSVYDNQPTITHEEFYMMYYVLDFILIGGGERPKKN